MAKRRHISAERKVRIIRQHLLEKVPISELCEQHGIQPTQFYQWQKQFFENGPAAFETAGNGRQERADKRLQAQVDHLQARLTHKDRVIAELVEHNIDLKKTPGPA